MNTEANQKNKYTEVEAKKLFYAKAKEVKNLEDLQKFYKFLVEETEHDYGTIVYAMTSFMVAAQRLIDQSPQGGITGFQAGFIGWEMVREYFHIGDSPVKLLTYENLLFPQYADKFEKTISKDTHSWLIQQATEKLKDKTVAHPDVVKHWQSISAGEIPFGFKVKED